MNKYINIFWILVSSTVNESGIIYELSAQTLKEMQNTKLGHTHRTIVH